MYSQYLIHTAIQQCCQSVPNCSIVLISDCALLLCCGSAILQSVLLQVRDDAPFMHNPRMWVTPWPCKYIFIASAGTTVLLCYCVGVKWLCKMAALQAGQWITASSIACPMQTANLGVWCAHNILLSYCSKF